MKTNTSLTIYHKVYDEKTRLDKWKRYNIPYVMAQGGKGASINKGYEKANDISVWIPYNQNDLSSIEIAIGDIVVCQQLSTDITKQSDLKVDNYNITTIINNNYGSYSMQHIYVGAK